MADPYAPPQQYNYNNNQGSAYPPPQQYAPQPGQQYAAAPQPYTAAPQPQYGASLVANPVYPPTGKGPSYEDTPMVENGERFNYKRSKYRDPVFAILFVVHVLGMGVVAAMYATEAFEFMANAVPDPNTPGGDDVAFDGKGALICLAASAVVALVFAAVWLKVIKTYADVIIKISLVMCVAWMVVGAGLSFYAGSMFGGIIFLVFAGLNALYYCMVKDRIPFTQAIIRAASQSIQDNGGTVCVTYLMAFVQIVWVVFWSFTVFAIYVHFTNVAKANASTDPNNDPNQEFTGINGVAYFLLLVSFYWTGQVLKNVCHVTTSGTVASWWLVPSVGAPVGGAFKRAMTTSFGSICFGSLIVAVLSAMREMVRQARNSAKQSDNQGVACMLCLAECMLSCIERMMNYFNMYAYTQVAIYGKSFIEAAKATWALFKARGWDALINDDLTGLVLMLGCLGGGVAAALAGGVLAFVTGVGHSSIAAIAVVAFLIGLVMVSLVMNVMQSAVATTFVLWAESPEELGRNRPQYYQKLVETAQSRYPDRSW